jgi:hypothetical protein
MNLEAILHRLQAVKRGGGGWMARCPAHADKSPSLSLRDENGKVLLHCFGGCSIEAISQALRIKVADLFCAPRKQEPRIVSRAQKQIAGLRSRLTPRDRERTVTVILAKEKHLELAIARALALAVEGELVQVALEGES